MFGYYYIRGIWFLVMVLKWDMLVTLQVCTAIDSVAMVTSLLALVHFGRYLTCV
jgi:hypothetical protein